MKRSRKAKIVATLGPASTTPQMIEKLFKKGVDVFRLNFSHGSHADHKARFDAIRTIEAKTGHSIGILMDLQGPKLRVGRFQNDKVFLKKGTTFRLDLDPALGNETRAQLPHKEIFAVLKKGLDLLIDDGKVRLKVVEHSQNHAITKVTVGGYVSNNKGLNVPGVMLPIDALTEKDKKDLAFGLELGVDWVALSFVQRPEDVLQAHAIIQGRAKIISKLEKPMAIQHLKEIVAASDGVMVARGDLGVEMLPEEVPSIQKRIVRLCREQGKPVVVATQMLESMISSPTPTRAEASDVATAIYDGADAVMLSAESASGDFPLESVGIMDRIICKVEKDPAYTDLIHALSVSALPAVPDSIAQAAAKVTQTLTTKALVVFTESGLSVNKIARMRPAAPILAITPHKHIARQLCLVWGSKGHVVPGIHHLEDVVKEADFYAQQAKFALPGDYVVLIAGLPFGQKGSTNMLHVVRCEGN